MKKSLQQVLAITMVMALATAMVSSLAADAGAVRVSASADIRVWVDDEYDVYETYEDVVLSIRAARDCYATVYVIDTEGFLHVVHPLSPYENAYVRGGVTYRFRGCDIGFGALAGRGIAHVFAVSSPRPFDYDSWGAEIFLGGFGFRVYGDPYVASRQFYVSILPRDCSPGFVSISTARFYVREWTRYPSYLCHSFKRDRHHVRFGEYCGSCSGEYDRYRRHAHDPYDVIKPVTRYKSAHSQIKRTSGHPGKHAGETNYAKNRSRIKAPARVSRVVSKKSRGGTTTYRSRPKVGDQHGKQVTVKRNSSAKKSFAKSQAKHSVDRKMSSARSKTERVTKRTASKLKSDTVTRSTRVAKRSTHNARVVKKATTNSKTRKASGSAVKKASKRKAASDKNAAKRPKKTAQKRSQTRR